MRAISRTLALLALLPIGCATPTEPAPRRPNVLFFFTDDQRWDGISLNPRCPIQTPHIGAADTRK